MTLASCQKRGGQEKVFETLYLCPPCKTCSSTRCNLTCECWDCLLNLKKWCWDCHSWIIGACRLCTFSGLLNRKCGHKKNGLTNNIFFNGKNDVSHFFLSFEPFLFITNWNHAPSPRAPATWWSLGWKSYWSHDLDMSLTTRFKSWSDIVRCDPGSDQSCWPGNGCLLQRCLSKKWS